MPRALDPWTSGSSLCPPLSCSGRHPQVAQSSAHRVSPSQAEQYGTLYAALEGTLANLSPVLSLHAAMLAVFPEDTNVPLPVVAQLWGASEADVASELAQLEACQLVDADWTCRCLSLIDLCA